MRLKINLATRRYVNMGAVKAGLGAAGVLLAVALLFQVQDAAYTAGEIKRLKAGTDAATARAGKVQQVSEPQYRDAMGRVRAANQMLEQKALDWVTLLDNLETVVPDGVALTAIEPDRKGKTVKLSAVTRNFTGVRAFLENMERSSYFSEVYLLTQQQTKVGLTQHGVAITVSCKVGQL